MAECLSNLTLDPVSLHRKFEISFSEYQTDPGMSEIIWSSQDQKIPMRNLNLYVVEDFTVIRWSQQTMRFREI